MVHGAIIRTYAQQDSWRFAHYGRIPTINALTDDEHPCQVLADLLTMVELCGGYEGKKVVFMGDGDNNMARSWMWAAEKLGFELVICAPAAYQPSAGLPGASSNPATCHHANRIPPKPWPEPMSSTPTSGSAWAGGGSRTTPHRPARLWQINSALVAKATPGAIVMHCLPAYRGKEISGGVPRSPRRHHLPGSRKPPPRPESRPRAPRPMTT